MRWFALFNICILMAAALFLNVACQGDPPPPPVPPSTEDLAKRLKTAERVKKAFEASHRIEKTATGYRLGRTNFNDETSTLIFDLSDWKFIINHKEKRTIEITAPGVGTAKFKFDNFGNLKPLLE